MCSKEEVMDVVRKSEERIMKEVRAELALLQHKAQETIIDRNSVHDQLARLLDITSSNLEQAKKTNGRVNSIEMREAVHNMEKEALATSIKEIQSVINRLNWLIITAVMVALLSLVVMK
jgi:CHASE3 domain sensor protein